MRRFALLLGVGLSLLTSPAIAQTCDGYTDVPASSPFCSDVTWITTYGITKGCAPSLFCPDEDVTRLQMAAFMHRLGENPAFVNGGNAFGETAQLGTNDGNALALFVASMRGLLIEPPGDGNFADAPNIVGGSPLNSVPDNVSGATIAGGGSGALANVVGADFGTVSGGIGNGAFAYGGTVAGGDSNIANGVLATIAGGQNNRANGHLATVAGGNSNSASGDYSFAAGSNAQATTTGSFIWADTQPFPFGPSVDNFFGVRATGGVGLTIAINPITGAVTQFCNLLPPIASWSCTSDRDAKENFIAADGKDILQRLVAMPLFSWNFKGADPSIRSLGPTAQDFYAAFGLGRNDKSIANVNLEGVALAAVQGLNAKVDEQNAQLRVALEDVVKEKDRQQVELAATIREQQREIADLSERVQKAETLATDVAALKAALAQLQRGRETVAVK